jgi:hypothetical protein
VFIVVVISLGLTAGKNAWSMSEVIWNEIAKMVQAARLTTSSCGAKMMTLEIIWLEKVLWKEMLEVFGELEMEDRGEQLHQVTILSTRRLLRPLAHPMLVVRAIVIPCRGDEEVDLPSDFRNQKVQMQVLLPHNLDQHQMR